MRVACILPVNQPLLFVDNAIRHFVQQDLPSRTLVLVGDRCGVPACPAARELGRFEVITLAHNRIIDPSDLGIVDRVATTTRADAVTWWLPTDWMGRDRLSRQLSQLNECGAAGVGVRDCLTYRLDTGSAEVAAGPTPGTAMLRVSSTGVDAAESDIVRVTDPPWYVSVVAHPQALSLGNRSFAEVAARIGRGIGVYERWWAGHTEPEEIDSVPGAVNVAVPLYVYDGLGSMGEYVVRSFLRSDIPVNVVASGLDRAGLHPDTLNALDVSESRLDGPTLALVWAGTPFDQFANSDPLIVISMWESTKLPAGVAQRLNRAYTVIAPSTWVAELFRKSGVTAPVIVIPQGVDPERYPLIDRPAPDPDDDAITALIVATLSPRKNIPAAIDAWQDAFRGNANARLLIKARFRWGSLDVDDPRIGVVDSEEATPGIAHWYRRADVVLALGGEGFGLPLVEAMACGLPVIALDAQGQSDVVDAARGCLLPVAAAAWVPYDDGVYTAGLRAVPDVAAVADALRWVTDNRLAAWQLGRRASDWVHRNRNIWDMGARIVDVANGTAGFVNRWFRPREDIALDSRRHHPVGSIANH
jgi:glycosyltransferase involved in cell wall biosynthesis